MTIKDMGIGDVLKLGSFCMSKYGQIGYVPHDIEWLKASSNCDFITKHIEAYFDFDAPEPVGTNQHRATAGNNCYSQSNIHQYLNAVGKQWFTPTHEFDDMSRVSIFYSNRDGFLSHFEEWERNLIIPREITCQIPSGSRRALGSSIQITCKVMLPSASELGLPGFDNAESEVIYDIFDDDHRGARGTIFHPELQYFLDNNIANSSQRRGWYMLRSVKTESDCAIYVIRASGSIDTIQPRIACGVRPTIRLTPSHEVVQDVDGYYTCVTPDGGYISGDALTTILEG